MYKIAAIIALLLLSACKSSEEVKADWIKFCIDGEFTVKQCEVLYSLKKSSDDASDGAAVASAMSGAAMGMSAGRR